MSDEAERMVRQVQTELMLGGYLKGPSKVDGLLGPETINAIVVRALDLRADGSERPAVVAVDKGRTETPERVFLRDVERELSRARDKFPSSEGCMTALTEEVGELAKAMLDEPGERIYKEAVQTAVMAARVALEGDRSLENYRINRHGADVGRARGVRP